MISRLKGVLEHFLDQGVIVDVGGVGYQVFCATKTIQRLGDMGAPVSLWIETIVRENSLQLFGFLTLRDQDWFRLFLTVQGVGARMALNLLSAFEGEDLARAILSQDKTLLTRAEGVGPKLAARLITELKERVEKLSLGLSLTLEAGAPALVWGDALSALCNLGYDRLEAQKALDQAGSVLGETPSLDQLIRRGLLELGQRGAS